MRNPQLNQQGALNHLLTTEGLPPRILNRLLDLTQDYLPGSAEVVHADAASLSGRRVFSLFFDDSARIRQSFDAAASRLSAQIVHLEVDNVASKTSDALFERLADLQTAAGDVLVLSHPQSGAPYLVTQTLAPAMHVINAGDGTHADPTQALTNVYTIRHLKNNLSNLTVALTGDVLHSREARSTIHALTTLGVAEVRVVGPLTLMPKGLEQLGVRVCTKMSDGLRDADVVLALPDQHERLPASLRLSVQDYAEREGLDMDMLAYAKPDCLLMQTGLTGQMRRIVLGEPGEAWSTSASDIGTAVRMAALSLVVGA